MFIIINNNNHFKVSFAIIKLYYTLAFYRPPWFLEMHKVTTNPDCLRISVVMESTIEASRRARSCWVDDIWERLYPGFSFWPSSKVSKPKKKVCSLYFSPQENVKEVVCFFAFSFTTVLCFSAKCASSQRGLGGLHLRIIDLFWT